MTVTRREFLQWSGAAAALAVSVRWASKLSAQQGAPVDPLRHVANRLTWGPMPDDIARLEEMGIEGYIDWQLDYESIPDPAIESWLTKYPYLQGTAQQIEDAAYADDYVYTIAPWQRVYRAAYSERQLYELMVEFWTDHFNVPASDSMGRKLVDDREVIRSHALGQFRDLLFASAQSPAMLYYLNNAESYAEHPNENYAREVMELHTLGVDGGYTETDVREVARAMTGWTVRDAAEGEQFFYDHSRHDTGAKFILGHDFAAGRGIEDGLQVLDLLATHPSTARHVSRKLIRRFVSDAPPAGLIDSAAQVFVNTQGDIRQVMRHILTSADFMAATNQKFRRPIDFMVALLRALRPGLTFGDRHYIVWGLEDMGQLPYGWHPPNGYPDAAEAWMNTNGLLNRWNLALNAPYASQGWYDGVQLSLEALVAHTDTVGQLVSAAAVSMLGDASLLSRDDYDALVRFVSDGAGPAAPVTDDLRADRLPALLGILLAAPQFQWH